MASVYDTNEHEINLLKGRVEELEAKVKTMVPKEEFDAVVKRLEERIRLALSGYRTRLK